VGWQYNTSGTHLTQAERRELDGLNRSGLIAVEPCRAAHDYFERRPVRITEPGTQELTGAEFAVSRAE
jgi:hypothetical protein